ncbi:hypothetical protein V1512DRAFT_249743 [Lipomyces arxii]|uniref:uncharacterized protein n=1 Tax=Lipomyces arxii TaxID=56418 RepID=UPI0034CF1B04
MPNLLRFARLVLITVGVSQWGRSCNFSYSTPDLGAQHSSSCGVSHTPSRISDDRNTVANVGVDGARKDRLLPVPEDGFGLTPAV